MAGSIEGTMRHLLRFYSGEGKPTLIHRISGGESKGGGGGEGEEGAAYAKAQAASEVSGLELEGRQDIVFSDRLSCIGFRTPDGYCRCPNRAIHTRQCPTCSALDISRAYTKGDFSGYPSLYEEAKKQEYVLYLAGFGEDIVKCGVTRAERFEHRMREQGADFGAIVAKYIGPDEIYKAETALQSRFNFSNAVRLAQKMRRLEFDSGFARDNFSAHVELVRSSGVLPDFKMAVRDFSEFYPRVKGAKETQSILGDILGAKGEILLFKSEHGRHFAVNMRHKVGTFF
jgi:hypothetical protein